MLHNRGWIVQESERVWWIVNYGVNRLLLRMNFCTDKKISVFWLIVNSIDPTNRNAVDKGIGRLRANMWRCLGMLVWTVEKITSKSLYSTTCTTRWIYNIFRNRSELRALHPIRILAWKICPKRLPTYKNVGLSYIILRFSRDLNTFIEGQFFVLSGRRFQDRTVWGKN
jgi:hypothetical protein